MKHTRKIACAVLAGGKSSRMGQDKAFLQLKGSTFLESICQILEDTGLFDEKIISSGSRDLESRKEWKTVKDLYRDRGPIGGIHAVLGAASSSAVFFLCCDMPYINEDLIRQIYDSFTGKEEGVAVITRDGRKHPLCAIYQTSVFEKAEAAIKRGEYGMGALLEKSQIRWIFLKEGEEAVMTNINTPEEYLKIKDKEIAKEKGVKKNENLSCRN